jgi:hypothetical protein
MSANAPRNLKLAESFGEGSVNLRLNVYNPCSIYIEKPFIN